MNSEPKSSPPVRGRGAHGNPPNRFESQRRALTDEHIEELLLEHPEGQRQPTVYYRDRARSIINPVDSPDLPFRFSINPYRGCEHGCSYCYARPTHETLGFSAGLDFETRIMVKEDAPALLLAELSRPSWKGEPIAMSGVTDAYQPIEAKLEITRRCLELMVNARQPVMIVTKSALVTRDIDLLRALADHDAVSVGLSVTTLDRSLSRKMEPRAATPAERIETIRRLADAGIPVSVFVAPIVPGLTDHEVPAILRAASDAGATSATYVLLRLPLEVKTVFWEWLLREVPERASHVASLIRSTREGALNESRFGVRMRGMGPHAEHIAGVFRVFRRKLGLTDSFKVSSAAFRRPTITASGEEQLELWS